MQDPFTGTWRETEGTTSPEFYLTVERLGEKTIKINSPYLQGDFEFQLEGNVARYQSKKVRDLRPLDIEFVSTSVTNITLVFEGNRMSLKKHITTSTIKGENIQGLGETGTSIFEWEVQLERESSWK